MIADSPQWPTNLWTKYYRELLAFLTDKLRCPQEAQDVAQDTFIRLLTMDNPTTIRHPRAFLYRIARNLAVDSSRKHTVRLAT
jgi:DNA-directed RNA polymerase specialized sigma24 family protein